MNIELIKKVDAFLCENIEKSAHYEGNNQRAAEYRIEHSRRVANIGFEIARAEGFDCERMYVAGLLHDIGYSLDYSSGLDFRDHGRLGAQIAMPFLHSLGAYTDDRIEEICYGIAIHVDDKSDFEYERTPLALTVADADNIDRFDAFRLYENLMTADYRELPINDQRALLEKRVNRLCELREMPCGTATGKAMWQAKVDYQIDFYRRLGLQIDNSYIRFDIISGI